MKRIAMIGAGISGMTCASRLQANGLEVVVFDKSRGPGGRITTRRRDSGRFDHGAQYFTARDERFLRHVRSWQAQGVVASWPDQNQGNGDQIAVIENGEIKSYSTSEQRFVGTPGMNAIGKHLADGLELGSQSLVSK